MGKYEKKNTTLSILFIVMLMAISCLIFMETSNAAGDAYISNSNNTIKNVTADTSKDTIHMDSGTYKGSNNRNIGISRNISFIGQNGTVIDAERNNRVFTVHEGSKLKLSNLNIMNGYSSKGAAIYIKNGGFLELENCKFISNFANDGSAIYNDNGYLKFSGCDFINNTATSGKTISSNGGTIIGNLQNGGSNSYLGNSEQFNTKLYMNTSFKNNKIHISVYAYDISNNSPIVGETITFLINNLYSAAVTNSKGVANLIYIPTTSGLHKITASLESTGNKSGNTYSYLRSSITDKINVNISKNSGDNSADERSDINVKVSVNGDRIVVYMKDNDDDPLSNIGLLVKNKRIDRTLGFYVSDSKGVITFTYKGDKSQLKLSFNGNDIYKPFSMSLSNTGNKDKGQNSNKAKSTGNSVASGASEKAKTSEKYSYGSDNSIKSENDSSRIVVGENKTGIPIAILFVLVLLSIIVLRKKL